MCPGTAGSPVSLICIASLRKESPAPRAASFVTEARNQAHFFYAGVLRCSVKSRAAAQYCAEVEAEFRERAQGPARGSHSLSLTGAGMGEGRGLFQGVRAQ